MVGKVSSKAVDYKWNHSDPTVRSQEISPRRHEWPPAFSAHYQASLRVSPHHLRRPPAGVLWTSWAGACSSPASGRRWTTKTGCGCCWEEKKEKKKKKKKEEREGGLGGEEIGVLWPMRNWKYLSSGWPPIYICIYINSSWMSKMSPLTQEKFQESPQVFTDFYRNW